MSDFCRDDDACQFSVTIGDGPLDVVRLCKMVNRGCSVAISREPFWYLDGCQHGLFGAPPPLGGGYMGSMSTYPIAKVLQSADGANAVTAIWSIVLAEICSEVVGSKRIMFPWVLPGGSCHISSCRDFEGKVSGLPNATLPFLIHAATVRCSYEAKRATSSPDMMSQTMAVWLAS